jgi:aspartyl-tRNA(Asn)/glutamyl-tRNA(Gln) amidotransferase subunit B
MAHDYRYFPEPDLPPLFIERAWLDELRERLPELPDARRKRYMDAFGLGAYDAEALSTDILAARLLEATVNVGADPKKVANYVLNDVARLRPEHDEQLEPTVVAPRLKGLIELVDAGVLNSSSARQVLLAMIIEGLDPSMVVAQLGLAQVSNSSELEEAVRAAIDAHPAAVADYKAGKDTAINFLKGQVMKTTRGKANPAIAEDLLRKLLG